MIVVAAGVPGRWSTWAFEALKMIASGAESVVGVDYVDRLDVVAPDRSDRRLFLSQYPNPSLAGTVEDPRTRFLLFREPPEASVAHLVGVGRVPFMEALRAVGASHALISRLSQGRKPIDVSGVPADRAIDLLKWFARVLGAELNDAAAAAMLARLGPIPDHDESVAACLDDGQAALVAAVLDGQHKGLAGGERAASTWPHGVFLSGDRPNQIAELITEVTGAARILYYGPYFHLPAGPWHGRATLGFSVDASGTPFAIEAHSNGLLGRAQFRPREAGLFLVEFRFQVDQPEHPIEICLRTDRGAIEGRVSLASVELLPADAPVPLEEDAGESVS